MNKSEKAGWAFVGFGLLLVAVVLAATIIYGIVHGFNVEVGNSVETWWTVQLCTGVAMNMVGWVFLIIGQRDA